jgi:DNA-binding Lrp family transcriptional regulator
MEFSRLPRFKRIPTVAPIELTERDHDIIRLVHRHRFLRSSQIAALIGGSPQQLLRRLQLLYHHGYLERPRAQIDYYHRGGTRPLIYGLGNKGGTLLKRELGVGSPGVSWGEKNRSVRGIFLEHALLVSDVMVALELACRKEGHIRLSWIDQFPHRHEKGRQRPFQWKVSLQSDIKLGVIPDRVFALEFPDQNGGSNRVHFFLEADRGTMPVTRKHLSQTSFRRKLLAYEATWSKSIHRTQFGFNRFRVLVVTTSPKRLTSIIEAARELPRGQGLFLFTDIESLRRSSSILNHLWQTTSPGVHATLLD